MTTTLCTGTCSFTGGGGACVGGGGGGWGQSQLPVLVQMLVAPLHQVLQPNLLHLEQRRHSNGGLEAGLDLLVQLRPELVPSQHLGGVGLRCWDLGFVLGAVPAGFHGREGAVLPLFHGSGHVLRRRTQR